MWEKTAIQSRRGNLGELNNFEFVKGIVQSLAILILYDNRRIEAIFLSLKRCYDLYNVAIFQIMASPDI